MKNLDLWLITNKPDIARFAISSGVDRIFVDLELIGKLQRQGHLSTVISYHTINDVKEIRKVTAKNQLLVRTNPVHPKLKTEIDKILDYGADVLMLPMWRSIEDVEMFVSYVSGRAKVCLLAETPESLVILPELCKMNEIDEFHIGLNDLHLALHKDFMFEMLTDGTLENSVQCLRESGKKFGIGGIARIGEGLVPAEFVLWEHVRTGSTAAILSRTFHRNIESLEKLKLEMNFPKEILSIKTLYRSYTEAPIEILKENHLEFQRLVSFVKNERQLV